MEAEANLVQLRDEVERLDVDVKTKEDNIGKIKGELENASKELQSKEAILEEGSKRIESLEDELKGKAELSKSVKKALEEELINEKDTAVLLQNNIERLKNELTEKGLLLSEKAAQLAEVYDRNESLKKEVEDTRSKFEKEKVGLRRQIEKAENRIVEQSSEHRSKLDSVNLELEQKRRSLVESESKIGAIKAELSAKEERFGKLKISSAEQDAQNQSRAEKLEYDLRAERYKGEVLSKDIKKLKILKKDLEAELEEERLRLVGVNEKVAESEKALGLIKEAALALQVELKKSESESESDKKKIKYLREKEKAGAESQDHASKLLKQKESEIQRMSEILKQREAELQKEREQVSTLEQEASEGFNEVLMSSESRLEKDLNDAVKRSEKLSSEIEEQEKVLQERNEMITERDLDLESKESRISDLCVELDEFKHKLQVAEEENKEVKRKYEEIEFEVEEGRMQLKSDRREFDEEKIEMVTKIAKEQKEAARNIQAIKNAAQHDFGQEDVRDEKIEKLTEQVKVLESEQKKLSKENAQLLIERDEVSRIKKRVQLEGEAVEASKRVLGIEMSALKKERADILKVKENSFSEERIVLNAEIKKEKSTKEFFGRELESRDTEIEALKAEMKENKAIVERAKAVAFEKYTPSPSELADIASSPRQAASFVKELNKVVTDSPDLYRDSGLAEDVEALGMALVDPTKLNFDEEETLTTRDAATSTDREPAKTVTDTSTQTTVASTAKKSGVDAQIIQRPVDPNRFKLVDGPVTQAFERIVSEADMAVDAKSFDWFMNSAKKFYQKVYDEVEAGEARTQTQQDELYEHHIKIMAAYETIKAFAPVRSTHGGITEAQSVTGFAAGGKDLKENLLKASDYIGGLKAQNVHMASQVSQMIPAYEFFTVEAKSAILGKGMGVEIVSRENRVQNFEHYRDKFAAGEGLLKAIGRVEAVDDFVENEGVGLIKKITYINKFDALKGIREVTDPNDMKELLRSGYKKLESEIEEIKERLPDLQAKIDSKRDFTVMSEDCKRLKFKKLMSAFRNDYVECFMQTRTDKSRYDKFKNPSLISKKSQDEGDKLRVEVVMLETMMHADIVKFQEQEKRGQVLDHEIIGADGLVDLQYWKGMKKERKCELLKTWVQDFPSGYFEFVSTVNFSTLLPDDLFAIYSAHKYYLEKGEGASIVSSSGLGKLELPEYDDRDFETAIKDIDNFLPKGVFQKSDGTKQSVKAILSDSNSIAEKGLISLNQYLMLLSAIRLGLMQPDRDGDISDENNEKAAAITRMQQAIVNCGVSIIKQRWPEIEKEEHVLFTGNGMPDGSVVLNADVFQFDRSGNM